MLFQEGSHLSATPYVDQLAAVFTLGDADPRVVRFAPLIVAGGIASPRDLAVLLTSDNVAITVFVERIPAAMPHMTLSREDLRSLNLTLQALAIAADILGVAC